MSLKIYTSESVTEGHPDKICDTIADTILDAFLEKDKFARVDCSALATHGLVVVTGEVSTKSYVDLHTLIRTTIKELGYTDSELGFDYRSIGVLALIREQSQQLGKIVDMRMAGDQGMMVGYATDEAQHLGCSLEYMPVSIAFAHRLMRQLALVRKDGSLPYLRPDGKGQVTVAYENGKPTEITSVVLAAQHAPNTKAKKLEKDLLENVVAPVFKDLKCAPDLKKIHINPGGPFVDGGPLTDSGGSGKKIVVDSYGSMSRHGGSSFSGKDPTKLDRSGAYFARYLAKNIVAAKIASRCEVSLAYFIGSPDPVSLAIDTQGTGKVNDDVIADFIVKNFDLSPAGILDRLDLRQPIYKATAAYGHFGRTDFEFPWERLDAVTLLGEIGNGRKNK